MNNWGMILFGWVAVMGAIGAYTANVVRRGRVLGRQVSDAEKPWT